MTDPYRAASKPDEPHAKWRIVKVPVGATEWQYRVDRWVPGQEVFKQPGRWTSDTSWDELLDSMEEAERYITARLRTDPDEVIREY